MILPAHNPIPSATALAWRRLATPFLLVLIASVITAILHYWASEHIFTLEKVPAWRGMVQRAGFWAPLLYVMLCIIGIMLMSPAIPWLLIAAMFGVVGGVIWGSLGITLGAGAAFLVARHIGQPLLHKLAGHTLEFRRIEKGVHRYGWQMVLLTRLVPIFPFNIQNFAYGLTSIRFGAFLFFTWLGTLPSVIAYVVAAGAVICGPADPRRMTLYLAAAAFSIAALSAIPYVITRKRRLTIAQFVGEEPPANSAWKVGSGSHTK